jgi:hypothetical protein
MLVTSAELTAETEEERRSKEKTTQAILKYQSREQATQSTRRMPGCMKPMKDAETGETFGGSCIQAMNPKNPNGATHPE